MCVYVDDANIGKKKVLLTGPGRRRSRRGPRHRSSWSSRGCWPSTAGSSAPTEDRLDRLFAAAVAVRCPLFVDFTSSNSVLQKKVRDAKRMGNFQKKYRDSNTE